MATRAFVVVTGMEAASGDSGTTIHLLFRYMREDEDSAVVGPANVDSTVPVDYSDNAYSLHEKIADKIRSDVDDPSLVVIFVDAAGHY